MTTQPSTYTYESELPAAALNASFDGKADLDPATGLLDVRELPTTVTAAITQAAAAETQATAAAAQAEAAEALASQAVPASHVGQPGGPAGPLAAGGTIPQAQLGLKAGANITIAADGTIASTGGSGGNRPWVSFQGNATPTSGDPCPILASSLIDHVRHDDIGLNTVFLQAGVTLPADGTAASGDALPRFLVTVGGYVGLIAGTTDNTAVIGGLNRQSTKPWGVDPDSGLYYVQIRTTYQAQPVGSTTGEDFDAVFVSLLW